MVLEYIEGETLSALLKRDGQLDPARLRCLLDELLSGLEQIHAAGFVHRDIKPGNIMFRKDGTAVLLDFGAARQAIGQRSKSVTSVLTPGYAPVEQYDQSATDVGPWTDLYALGMVAYRCLSGISDSQLLDAVTRARLERKGEQHKDLASAAELGKGRYDQALLKAVDWAMQVDEEKRPQSVAAIKQALAGDDEPAMPSPPAAAADQSPRPPKNQPGKRRWIIPVSALTAIALVALSWPTVQEQLDLQEENRRFTAVFGRVASPEAMDTDGLTDLHYAAAANMPELVKFLLDAGAKINARIYEDGESLAEISKKQLWELTKTNDFDKFGRVHETPLHFAAWNNASKAAELLITRGANVNAKQKNGAAPLHFAAGNNAHEVAELLIARGADLNAKNNDGETPLHSAAFQNAREAVELLITRGADVNAKDNNGKTSLHYAAFQNAREACGILIARGANVNAKDNGGGTPLHSAASHNAREAAELLVARGANVNAKDNGGGTPLHSAAFQNAREAVELLIDHGADVNARTKNSWTPLHSAASNNAQESAELLIDRGENVNAKENSGGTPLLVAVFFNSREAAELLIVREADVNAKGKESGQTMLHDAALQNTREKVELLITLGADINAKDMNGKTPLHYAASNNAREVAELLITRGADVNAKDKNGWTPLHFAVSQNAHEVVELLIDRKANINAKDKRGSTPLHVTVSSNALESAELLIARGANINTKDANGWTPRDYTEVVDHSELKRLLR